MKFLNETHTQFVSVRDAERFAHVQIGHVRTKVTWSVQGHLSVHVSTVHTNMPETLMDHVTHFHHLILENSVSRRIGDLYVGQPILKLVRNKLHQSPDDGVVQ